MSCYSADGLLDDGVGEVELGGLGIGEARLEGVAQSHEFVDFGDDAVLFFYRRKWHSNYANLSHTQVV